MYLPLISRISVSIFRIIFFGLILFFVSCSDTKKLTYFNDQPDGQIKAKVGVTESVIQANDLLSITVSSLNQDATAIFNAPNESTALTSSATSGGNTLTVGYLVNLNGDITYPVLGSIHAEGLTKSQLMALITKQLTDKKLLVDPIVTIRHLNFRISVLGEVARPGVFTIPNEKVSILEALSLAGDLTIYAKRDNVVLIRENGKGEKTIKRFNLNSKEILSSPYYYLESNDIIYAEPSKDRVNREKTQMLLPIILSITTLLIVVIDRLDL
jgi:polysaccharide export outer membrane protein